MFRAANPLRKSLRISSKEVEKVEIGTRRGSDDMSSPTSKSIPVGPQSPALGSQALNMRDFMPGGFDPPRWRGPTHRPAMICLRKAALFEEPYNGRKSNIERDLKEKHVRQPSNATEDNFFVEDSWRQTRTPTRSLGRGLFTETIPHPEEDVLRIREESREALAALKRRHDGDLAKFKAERKYHMSSFVIREHLRRAIKKEDVASHKSPPVFSRTQSVIPEEVELEIQQVQNEKVKSTETRMRWEAAWETHRNQQRRMQSAALKMQETQLMQRLTVKQQRDAGQGRQPQTARHTSQTWAF